MLCRSAVTLNTHLFCRETEMQLLLFKVELHLLLVGNVMLLETMFKTATQLLRWRPWLPLGGLVFCFLEE